MTYHEIIKKIIMLGDGGVGKTSLVRRYVVDQFDDEYIVTLGAKPTAKDVKYITKKGNIVNMRFIIWDILGQKDYEEVHKGLFSDVDGGILVFDIKRKETFDSLTTYWYPLFIKYSKNMPVVLLANKGDLIDKGDVSFNIENLIELSKKLSDISKSPVPYYIVSAKNGSNVENGFYAIGELLIEKMSL